MDSVVDTQHGEAKDKSYEIRVTVNGRPVILSDKKLTGTAIKQAAIAQGVPIQPDFVLFEVKPGGKLKPIGDQEEVTLHEGAVLRAVAPDDNS